MLKAAFLIVTVTVVAAVGFVFLLNLRYYAGAAHATLANYGPRFSLVSTNVQTRWEFDARDRLIDLRVTKQPFGP